MMKRFLLAALAAVTLTLSGCMSEEASDKLDAVVTQVQAKTAAICAFVPQAKVVIAILGGGDPTLTGAAVAASAICAAINRPMALYDGLHGPGRPEVNGVPIDGAFVPKGEDGGGEAGAGRITNGTIDKGSHSVTVPKTTYEELYDELSEDLVDELVNQIEEIAVPPVVTVPPLPDKNPLR